MRNKTSGFTLIELLVVLLILVIASTLVIISFPSSEDQEVEREATRLTALLETARSIARSSSIAVVWKNTEHGFIFNGLPNADLPGAQNKEAHWLNPNTVTLGESELTLGPEPIIAKQAVTIQLGSYTRTIQTDGLRPFTVTDTNGLEND